MNTHNLNALRTAAKLSLSQLAALTGIPRSTLGEAELYKTKLKEEYVVKLCKFFCITEDKFWK